jgi:hypothetical protein
MRQAMLNHEQCNVTHCDAVHIQAKPYVVIALTLLGYRNACICPLVRVSMFLAHISSQNHYL